MSRFDLAPITFDITSPLDLGPAERAAIDYLRAGRRVVVITTRNGERKLALHAIPFRADVLTVRGDNAMVSRALNPEQAVVPAFREARQTFDGFQDSRHRGELR